MAASVSSLDKDLRSMRLSKYTPQAAKEVREWIEDTLGEKLPPGDLLDGLKDGVVLCKLVNLAIPPPGVKYKTSAMPFVQMENISHFLRAIQAPPLNLPPHDVFLTVDLYESKDPAQVIQCLGAFSRVAHAANPRHFKTTIGPKGRGALSPQGTGASNGLGTATRSRGMSNASNRSASPVKGAAPLSPALTGGSSSGAPAWNIHLYGYMGGASQGNQGISFGGRRQITAPAPHIPSLAEKERRRKEEEAEQERIRLAEEEAEKLRQKEREAEEERARAEEERIWEEETRRRRELEKRQSEEEQRRWEDEERRWKEQEERRIAEERSPRAKMGLDRQRTRVVSDPRLQGQFLSQYKAEQERDGMDGAIDESPIAKQQSRVLELERELEQARERERQYEREREERHRKEADRRRVGGHDVGSPEPIEEKKARSRSKSRSRPQLPQRQEEREDPWARARHEEDQRRKELERQRLQEHDLYLREKEEEERSRSRTQARPEVPPRKSSKDSWMGSERDYLRQQWAQQHQDPSSPPPRNHNRSPTRPLPDPSPVRVKKNTTGPSSRPLPDPTSYVGSSRTDRFLAHNPAPVQQQPASHFPSEFSFSTEAEQHAETSRRIASTEKTRAGGWASKSLLEREMERERERQQEWESSQRATRDAASRGVGRGVKEGTIGDGGAWDVNQYGYTDGANQGKEGVSIGARRQIIGPRPPP